MRRPVVLWFVIVLGIAAALVNILKAVGALLLVGRVPFQQVAVSLLIFALIVAGSSWITLSLLRRSIRSKTPVSIYLWFLLLIYPLCNVLRAAGLFVPGPEYRPEELAGAAAVELLRYVLLIGLIVWVGFSKALKAHLVGPDVAAAAA
jgi:hypothetical protein